jgi:hypothetical protein
MSSAAQLALIDEPQLYLSQRGGPAYFATLVKDASSAKPWNQTCYPVGEMPYVLGALDRSKDSFISQGTFWRKQRRIATLSELGLVFADLDSPYLAELFATCGEAAVVEAILRAVDEEHIPAPSLIVSSGRGFHVKWLFESAVPWKALNRWSALEKTIVSRLHASLHADRNCTDAARVLRLCGTVNTKSGEIARVIWENRFGSAIVRYPFDRLADEVLVFKRPTHHERAEEHALTRKRTGGVEHRSAIAPTYTVASLWWSRFRDLRKLCEIRGWNGERGVPEGHRDLVLFLGAIALSWYAPMKTWWPETAALAKEFAPTLREAEWRQYVGTTWRRMEATAQSGHEDRYRYRTDRLVAMLDISPDEQAKLEVLVAPEVAAERKRENDRKRVEQKRRAAGTIERGVYVARADERAQKAKDLAESGLSYSQIADRLGVSRRHAIRLVTSASRCISWRSPTPEGRSGAHDMEAAVLEHEARSESIAFRPAEEALSYDPTFFGEKRSGRRKGSAG